MSAERHEALTLDDASPHTAESTSPRAGARKRSPRPRRGSVRVSEFFHLGRTQPALDFVDVDVHGDVRLYVDPRALRLLPTAWGQECVSLIQNYFQTVIDAIKTGERDRALRLLAVLREPNESHLGLSRGTARGRGMGKALAREVYVALEKSRAVESGLLTVLEDSILLVDGIDRDIVSDIATNIIRGPLIAYTQDVCERYGIAMRDLDSGPLWDPSARAWQGGHYVALPEVGGRRLLLVPKIIVRRRFDYDKDEYFQHYILTHLQDFELGVKSELVQLLRNGTARVTKKSVIGKYGRGKALMTRITREHPEILAQYRTDRDEDPRRPLEHEEIATEAESPQPNWDALLDAVLAVPAGRATADDYHRAVESLLTALFYPSLCHPKLEYPIHDGRKRLDVTYANTAQMGFFSWLATHYPSSNIIVECKNYVADVANPELDQLSGRFSPNRGRVGLLLCRTLEDRDLFVARCRDTANDGRGFIIVLDDDDLRRLVAWRKVPDDEATFAFLKECFDELVM